jgi:hypothetical protein
MQGGERLQRDGGRPAVSDTVRAEGELRSGQAFENGGGAFGLSGE